LTDNVKGKTEITVSSLSGQSVYTQVLTTNGAQSHVVATKNLASGLYIVAVRVGATVQTEKMVVTH
jgi:hypothetical protein